ncbi:hypothetical protein D9758_008346 [Tetrapyrgos nigripes]|uniref:Hydroxyquinol 1,2-dioxygenase n=1 Tax=Tetrapyrgos nigripes TaxID=182062 RepID=A0A8H5GE85_9AGAR|nr:hypothetical protein D9758_008346 [Tetrapyrgos nigripes]
MSSTLNLTASKHAAQHGKVDLSKMPKMMEMSATSITEQVLAINNANCSDERMKFVFERLVQHLHDFVRETFITTEEWVTAIKFLTEAGQTSTDHGQESVMLLGILGVPALIDTMNNAKPPKATEAAVLGPFFIDDAHDLAHGDSIASEGKGEYMYVHGKVADTKGNPVANALINAWEADETGSYDAQYEVRDGPECRGRLRTNKDGKYAFRAVVPVSYPVPAEGTVGKLLDTLGRHPFRPAHLHLRVEAPGYEKLITQLYINGDPYLTSDTAFGVKSSLIVDLKPVNDPKLSAKRGFGNPDKVHMELERDIILATPEEGAAARKKLHEDMLKSMKTGLKR